PRHARLIDCHVHLYNATAKGAWFHRYHPRSFLVNDPELVELILRVKPNFEPDDSADSFINTRVIHHLDRRTLDDAPPIAEREAQRLLMPLIDLLNNHTQGAPFRGKNGIRVDVAQPLMDDECYAFYGHVRSDPLNLCLEAQ
ncbi:hypothetical protein RZS08_26690, partial [Arthrospira platensis SPKY1]|nr:hypothetical protein [Arthrospira platensis SPKY1]